MNQSRFQNIAIVGFGKEGLSVANYFKNSQSLLIFDRKTKNQLDSDNFKKLKAKNVQFFLGEDYFKIPHARFDLIVRSPGVQPHDELIQKLKKGKTLVTTATKIFFDEFKGTIIGVTGTKGKGTTATLIYRMLKNQYQDVFIAGNIGICALDILPQVTPKSLVVLELSSFQLIDLTKSPQVAVVLMITSEHLDWHTDTMDYQKAKESIVCYQKPTDYAVINADYPISKSFAKKTRAKIYFFSTHQKVKGAYLEDQKITISLDMPEVIAHSSQLKLPGIHNLQNVLAASIVAKIFKVKNKKIQTAIATFKSLPHRLELITTVKGVKFYNDSFSTTPETTIAAIESFANPLILILGGSSKKSDFTNLAQIIGESKNIKAVILVGQEAPRIEEAISKVSSSLPMMINGGTNMSQIVQKCFNLAQAGDLILLSPACASFDMFKNYQDRGERFIKEANFIRKKYATRKNYS